MGKHLKRLPDSELKIMKIIWKVGTPVQSAYIQNQIKGKKDWAACTILVFLSRLVEKGYLTSEKQGKVNIYTAVVDEQDYLQVEGRSFLEKLYGNSLKTLIASLYDGNTINDRDLEELRQYIDDTTRGKS